MDKPKNRRSKKNPKAINDMFSPKLPQNKALLRVLTSVSLANIPRKAETFLKCLLSFWDDKVKDKVQLGESEQRFVRYLWRTQKILDRNRQRDVQKEPSVTHRKRIIGEYFFNTFSICSRVFKVRGNWGGNQFKFLKNQVNQRGEKQKKK